MHASESLWEQVIDLLTRYPRSKVLNSLGISTSQLQKKLKDRIEQPRHLKSNPADSNQRQVNPPGKFVKATVAVPQPLPATPHVHDVILTRSNGATLHIQQF